VGCSDGGLRSDARHKTPSSLLACHSREYSEQGSARASGFHSCIRISGGEPPASTQIARWTIVPRRWAQSIIHKYSRARSPAMALLAYSLCKPRGNRPGPNLPRWFRNRCAPQGRSFVASANRRLVPVTDRFRGRSYTSACGRSATVSRRAQVDPEQPVDRAESRHSQAQEPTLNALLQQQATGRSLNYFCTAPALGCGGKPFQLFGRIDSLIHSWMKRSALAAPSRSKNNSACDSGRRLARRRT
jgi:hypothetical protein